MYKLAIAVVRIAVAGRVVPPTVKTYLTSRLIRHRFTQNLIRADVSAGCFRTDTVAASDRSAGHTALSRRHACSVVREAEPVCSIPYATQISFACCLIRHHVAAVHRYAGFDHPRASGICGARCAVGVGFASGAAIGRLFSVAADSVAHRQIAAHARVICLITCHVSSALIIIHAVTCRASFIVGDSGDIRTHIAHIRKKVVIHVRGSRADADEAVADVAVRAACIAYALFVSEALD